MSNWNPNYGDKKEFKKENRYYMEDGDVVFRILPPPDFEERNDGVWSKFYSLIIGYKNTEGKVRPFQSCLEDKYDKETNKRVVVVSDPALDRIKDLKDKLDTATKEGNANVVKALQPLVGFPGLYRNDKGHYMNVIGLDGNIGLLKIGHKAKLALDIEIKKLRAKGVDPLSFDNGRFFVFSKSGKGRDTTPKVSVYEQEVQTADYGTVKKELVHKITPEILLKLKTDGKKLEGLYPELTRDEIKRIVETSDLATGKSPYANQVFDDRWKAKRDAGGLYKPNNNLVSSVSGTVSGNITATAADTKTPSPTPVQATTTPVQAAPAKAVDEMSYDEFMKEIGQ